MIHPPRNAKVYDWPSSTFWFDEEGIVYSISKKAEPPTLEQTRETLDEFKKIIGRKKVCILIDVTNSPGTTREVRNYAADEFPKFVKAIALVSDSALGKMFANIFFTIKKQPYPTKMFTDENEAREWLRQYL